MATKLSETERVYENIKTEILPYECWERLPHESTAAFAAFCVFRDFGGSRNIKRALAVFETDEAKRAKRYRMWRQWSTDFAWYKRAADYDNYLEKIKVAERCKTIEQREVLYRDVTDKMLRVVQKKLDCMEPSELGQGTVSEWVKTAIGTERELSGIADRDGAGAASKQPEINFSEDFRAL